MLATFSAHYHSWASVRVRSDSSEHDCWCGQELQNTLRQVQKLLSSHQTSFQQSLRSVRKKLSLLQNNTDKHSKLNTGKQSTGCPSPEPLANGRILGRGFKVGHEIHFLCSPGFQLMGLETRRCLDTQTWSGTQPSCKFRDGTEYNNASVPASASSSSHPPTTTRPSRCIEFLGSTHCTCEQGYSISRQDTKLCTDLDECELYHRTQPGRLCLHTCVNTAGSFFCQCPSGYSLARDSRSCHDIDECVRGAHNCSREQVCVNTHGGHRCVEVECPRFRNATYIKTSALRCDRNPCLQEDKACLQAPLSVNFHFMSVVSNMSAPTVLFRLSAARVLGDTLRFGLMGNRGVQYFTIQRSGRETGQLVLVNSVQGPATLQADIEMSELEKKVLLGRYVTKVTLFVSPYNF
ncbi:fibulin-7-like isoform X1 [Triplophysa dalaica]|uniref:fibulin-7-like isoform X1 n=1 Tax=Triplophysa dalaica TaxID=1582913 RepID=UPI0024DFE738|nr:fibulin-7-like isoform X1 [Triplophysa dalaica]XP_056595580.1 fibulin-7-like isoform X1 [Triplophysa dalaica]